MQLHGTLALLALVSARFGIDHAVSRQHFTDTMLLLEILVKPALDAAFEPVSHERRRIRPPGSR